MRVTVKVAGIWVTINLNPRELLLLLSFAYFVKKDIKGNWVFGQCEYTINWLAEIWSLNNKTLTTSILRDLLKTKVK